MDLGMNYYGISGLLLLILDVWALVSIINSSATTSRKVLWVVLVLVLPLLGFVAWFIFGPRDR